MISLNDVLLAMSNIPVDDPIAEIWGQGLQGGYKVVEYTGTFPITITANGDALLDYRIYGVDGGVGEPTENLWNPNTAEKKMIVFNGLIENAPNYALNTIPIESDTTYYFYALDKYISNDTYWQYQNNNNEIIGDARIGRNVQRANFTTPKGATKVIICFAKAWDNDKIRDFGVYKRSTAPESYIPYGYKLPMTVSDQNLLPDNISQFRNGYISAFGTVYEQDATKKEKYSDYVSIVPNTSYTFAMANGFPGNPSGNVDTKPWCAIAFYSQNKTFISRSVYDSRKSSPFTVTSPSDAFFVRVTWRSFGSEECPVLVTNRNIYPVYIGENQLTENEYVSYGEQKIYRDVSGTLTPTDPPVPLPQIPTIDGTTVIDYDGDPKPSQMYVKYKGKSGGA